jgi:hypothetical protein
MCICDRYSTPTGCRQTLNSAFPCAALRQYRPDLCVYIQTHTGSVYMPRHMTNIDTHTHTLSLSLVRASHVHVRSHPRTSGTAGRLTAVWSGRKGGAHHEVRGRDRGSSKRTASLERWRNRPGLSHRRESKLIVGIQYSSVYTSIAVNGGC